MSDHKADLDELGIDNHAIELNSSSFDSVIASIAPDVVIFDRYMTEEQFSWRVKEACPNALRVLNTEDLHSLRQARLDAVKTHCDAAKANLNSELAQREIALQLGKVAVIGHVADLDGAGAEAVAAEVGGLGRQVDVAVEADVLSLVQLAERVFDHPDRALDDLPSRRDQGVGVRRDVN